MGDDRTWSVHSECQEPQPTKPKNERPKPPIPDTENDSPEYWEAVLDSYGLADPDVQMRRFYPGGPIYKFACAAARAYTRNRGRNFTKARLA